MITTLDYLVKIGGVIALILGLAFWSGELYSLVHLHAALGVGVVLGLWAMAFLAFRRGVSTTLVVTGAAWGLATISLGLAQTQIFVASSHWVVQVVHLLLGLGSIVLAAFLKRKLLNQAAVRTSR